MPPICGTVTWLSSMMVKKSGRAVFFVRKVVKQRVRRLAGLAAVKVARVIFYPVAVAYLADQRQVVVGAALKPLGLEQLALRSNLASCSLSSCFDVLYSAARSSSGVT
jgi:hypothetical protein